MIHELLRSAAEGTSVSRSGMERLFEERLLNELDYEGISALLYPHFGKNKTVPEQARDRLRYAYENALVYKDLALQTLRELRNVVPDSVRLVLMQGMALVEHLYPEPWARPMDDIDLFLPDLNSGAVHEALRKNGFTPYRSYDQVWRRKGLVIDLHLDFWGADRVPERGLLFGGTPIDLKPSALLPGFLVPVAPIVALHAAFHALKHGFARKRWLFDLLMLFRAGHCNALLKRTDTFIGAIALDRLVAAGLITREAIAGVPVAMPKTRRFLLRRLLENGARPGYGEMALALSRPGFWAPARYLLGSMFPPKRALVQMYGHRSRTSLLMRRIISLSGKAAR
jgi:hypothetical protein